jgi:hypothetical protein
VRYWERKYVDYARLKALLVGAPAPFSLRTALATMRRRLSRRDSDGDSMELTHGAEGFSISVASRGSPASGSRLSHGRGSVGGSPTHTSAATPLLGLLAPGDEVSFLGGGGGTFPALTGVFAALGDGRFARLFEAEVAKASEFFERKLRVARQQHALLRAQAERLAAHGGGKTEGMQHQSLKRAYIEIHRQMCYLRSFGDVNYLCVVKLVEKFDKLAAAAAVGAGVAPAPRVSEEVMGIVAGLSIGDMGPVNGAIDEAEAEFAAFFTRGRRPLARVALLVEQRAPFSWGVFDTGVHIGVLVMLCVWALWDVLVDADLRGALSTTAFHAVVPIYRGLGCLLLVVWLWAVQLFVWNQGRVNYMLLFDSDPRSSLDYRTVFREASSMTVWFLCDFILFYKLARNDAPRVVPPSVMPLALALYFLWKLIFPLRERRGLWRTIWESVIAPFAPMRFRHNYAADFMTSLVRPLMDVAYIFCYYASPSESAGLDASPECASYSSTYNLWVSPRVHALPLVCVCARARARVRVYTHITTIPHSRHSPLSPPPQQRHFSPPRTVRDTIARSGSASGNA